jgi:hypothetical protein
MKKQILISTFFACLSMSAFARIWRVNNNAGINADFTTLGAAITAANSMGGDIIYVEPSATSYDENTTILVDKQVKIVGNGAFLAGKGLQVNTNESKFNNTTITFDVGSEGSFIYGITADAFNINAAVHTITIQRCKTNSVFILSAGNTISLLENWVSGNIISVGAGAISPFYIKNNIIAGYIYIKTDDVTTIENNTVVSTSSALILNNAPSVAVINNILKSGVGDPSVLDGTGAIYNNNISSDNAIPNTNGNQRSVDIATVLVALPFNSDSDAQLKVPISPATNPALNTGMYSNTDDIGAFNNGSYSNGAIRPSFVLGLIPPYPTIYALSGPTAPVITPTMNVTISTRSNN